jgi:hypothetical protein
VQERIETNKWYRLGVKISDAHIKGYLDGKVVIEYKAEKPVRGLVGLWTKADSVTYFDALTIQVENQEKIIEF